MKKFILTILFIFVLNLLNNAEDFRRVILYDKDKRVRLIINLDIINAYHKIYDNYNYLDINDTTIVYDSLKFEDINKKYKMFIYNK